MKLNKFICSVLSILLLLGPVLNVSAEEEQNHFFDSEEFVKEYYEAINEHDWERVSEFYYSKSKEDMAAFLMDKSNQDKHIGLLNVEHVKAIEIVDVDYVDAEYLFVNDYANESVNTFVVGADYDTYEDTEFYAEGVCYEIYSVVLEEEGWKIAEKRTVWDFDGLLDAGYVFESQYCKTEEVVEAREKGIILNYEGEYVDKVFDVVTCTDDMFGKGRASTVTTYAIPTENTKILYYSESIGDEIEKGFHTMCKAITYAECGSDATFGDYPEARKAIIMAIKTYVWHFYIIQESKDAGYHISSEQIAYNSNYKSTYGFLEDYSDVQGVWMQGTSSAGKPIVFEANFKKGSEEAQDNNKGNGDLKQLGCIYLLKNDSSISTYKDLLHFYYDNSKRSLGGAVQFFNSNKKFI